jgi:hypothetical protein
MPAAFAVTARRIGLVDAAFVFGEVTRLQIRREAVHKRLEAGRPHPFDDRGGRIHGMLVSRAPDVDVRGLGGQQVVITVYGEQLGAQFGVVAYGFSPRRFGRQLAHQAMRGLVAVVRHLDGQHAAGRQRGEQPRDQRGVVGHPLQGRIRINQLGRGIAGSGLPIGDVAQLEMRGRQTLARAGQHGFGVVGARDRGAGKAADQQPGGVAGPATQVEHVAACASGTRASSSWAGRVRSSS